MKSSLFLGNSLQELYSYLLTGPEGLSEKEAHERLKRFGKNEVLPQKDPSSFLLFLKQFKSPLIFLLVAMSLISFFLNKKADPWVILSVAFFNAYMGYHQEKKAKASLDSLKKETLQFITAFRNGRIQKIEEKSLVPGDIIHLAAGDLVPADAVMINGPFLAVEESFLTGEAHSQTKIPSPTLSENQWLYRGSLILKGKGQAVVVYTGKKTQIGQMQMLLDKEALGDSPLEKRIDAISRWLGIIAIMCATLLILIGLYKQLPLTDLFLLAASQIVSIIPEGLPIAITIVLSLGIRRLSEKRVIIRKLHAAESLGSVTLIACDKTGTLTENKMRLIDFYWFDKKTQAATKNLEPNSILAVALCNDSLKTADQKFEGDPTENALLEWAYQQLDSLDKHLQKHPRVDEIPFDPNLRLSATLHQDYGRVVKGALEALLPLTSLDLQSQTEILQKASNLQEEGYRLLAYGYDPHSTSLNLKGPLSFLGFAILFDPPRNEAKETLAWCQKENIELLMITGDHPSTAYGVSRALDLVSSKSQVVLASELTHLTQEKFNEKIPLVRAIARALPEDKYILVGKLQKAGHIVAMTGDGINDAPSLKKADIGVAMGRGGTSLAAYASSMIITDDRIETLIDGIREGKHIQTVVYHLVDYLITTSLSSIFVLLPCLLLDHPFPFTPLQLLWINVVTEGCITTTMVLSDLKKEKNINFFSFTKKGLKSNFSIPLLGLFLLGYDLLTKNRSSTSTEVFTLFAFIGLLKALFLIDRFSKSYTLLMGIFLGFFLQLIILYVPFLQETFETEPLSPWVLSKLLGLSVIFCIIYNFIKKSLRT